MATSDYNKAYYETNKEREKARALAYYHANKDQMDRDKQKAYMAEYLKTYQRKVLTPEEKAERSRKRREQYATDAAHREKVKAQARKFNAANPHVKRAGRLKAEFNLTPQEYAEMLESQGGGCAICGVKKTGVKQAGKAERSLSVDHCHTTLQVRGLLCHRCNFGLGHFQDRADLLQKAIEYLTKSSSGVT